MTQLRHLFIRLATAMASAMLEFLHRLRTDPVLRPLMTVVAAMVASVKADLILVPNWLGFAQVSRAQAEFAFSTVERTRNVQFRHRLLNTAIG